MKQMNVRAADKKINTKGTMGRLFRFMKPYRIRIILMVACLVMGAVFTTQGPYTWQGHGCAGGRGRGQRPGSSRDLRTFSHCSDTIGLCVCTGLSFNYSGQYIVAGVAERTMHDLRMAVDKKIRRLPLAYFDSNTFGDVLSRVTNDVDTIDTSLQQSISRLSQPSVPWYLYS